MNVSTTKISNIEGLNQRFHLENFKLQRNWAFWQNIWGHFLVVIPLMGMIDN